MRSTRLATVAMASIALLLIVFDREILTSWLGAAYALKAAPILKLIVLGPRLASVGFPLCDAACSRRRSTISCS